uniref:Uncharacterized protein n=2 Tax=Ditylenchus dipsaci TaxID=166011 RepID=A0A915DLA7_9BILA
MTAFPEHAIASLSDVWATLSTSAHYFTLAKSALANLVMYCSLVVSAISTALSYWFKVQNVVLANAIITASVALFCFLSSLVFVAPAGIFMSNCWENLPIRPCCYGFRRLLVNLETMILEDSNILATSYSAIGIWYYCLTPAFLIIAICLKFVCNNRAVMNGQQFSYLLEGFGWFIFSSCVITIPSIVIAYAIVFRFKPGVIATTFEPTSFWDLLVWKIVKRISRMRGRLKLENSESELRAVISMLKKSEPREAMSGSKISRDTLNECVAEVLKLAVEKKRKFRETIELQVSLKNYDPQKDKRFSGTVKLKNIPRPKLKVCVLGDQQHIDEAAASEIPCMSADDLKKLNKD